MNKKEFEQLFKTEIEPYIQKDDKPALREAWNNTVDSFMRDGTLPKRAGNWSHPKRFYTPSENREFPPKDDEYKAGYMQGKGGMRML